MLARTLVFVHARGDAAAFFNSPASYQVQVDLDLANIPRR